MPIAAGDIIFVTANFVKPTKTKCLLFASAQLNSSISLINTDPYFLAPTAQLRVTPSEIPCLTHTSYIDTSKMVKLSEMETDTPVAANPGKCLKGTLSPSIKAKIVAMVAVHGIMPQHQVDIIKANFGPSAIIP